MALERFNESTLTKSEIWNGINDSGGTENTLKKAFNLIRTAKHLTVEDIEAAYIQVRQITDTLTRSAMKAFDEGRTVLVYNNVPQLSVTQALPFITLKSNNKYITYVFMDKYVSISRDNVITVQAPILRDLLIGALISTGLKNNYINLSSNQFLQKVLSDIYSKFVMRILNRQFSIVADKKGADTVQYWISRFFLSNVFGSNDTAENIETIASSHFRYIDELSYQDIKNQYDNSDPSNISELLDLLKTISPRMKGLNLGIFLNDWISYYYVASMLAIDNIEYLIFMIIALLNGNNGLVSISASDIVKETKNIKNLRGELLKLI